MVWAIAHRTLKKIATVSNNGIFPSLSQGKIMHYFLAKRIAKKYIKNEHIIEHWKS